MFVGARLVREDDVIRAMLRTRRPRPNHCFANAQRTVLSDESGYATYHEGYVLSGSLPIHHAWLVSSGTAFDPTLEAAARAESRAGRTGDDLRCRVYFGVPFTRIEVASLLGQRGAFVPLLDVC